ncbi:MAG TPA: hypothetical protein VNM66_01045, partial [Thermodesulfobacteriota bacterium]|nr:hypothetical protein [Thermodesulfobacteriota bacterium]
GAPVTPARTTFFFSGHFVFPLYPYYAYPYPYYVVPPPYRYRTYAELTGDLLRMGLHDGRLDPGASIHGFLYFPRADGERRGLRLRWSPPGAAAPLIAQVEDGAPAPRY